jgi:molybdopterin-guanine dinucleotide biosynthesis protein A
MGHDKAEGLWAGRRAVDRVVDLARACGARAVVTAGARDYGHPFVAEDPPGGGPAAGLAAAAALLHAAGCSRLLALAVDAPTLVPDDLAPLLAAPPPGAAYQGLLLPLVIEAAAFPAQAAAGWPMRRLVAEAGLALLAPEMAAQARLRGANTPAERAALLADLAAR